MEAYYSSDEEVAWGPLTLREIKKELQRPANQISRRGSDFGSYTYYTPSTSLSEKTGDVSKTTASGNSGTSAYFTPDDSEIEQTSSKNEVFLAQLSKAIDIETDAGVDDTISSILKTQSHGDVSNLEEVEQSLIENTIHDEVEEKTAVIEISDSSDEIITLSDESFNEDTFHFELANVKKRESSFNENSHVEEEVEDQTTLNSSASSDDSVTNSQLSEGESESQWPESFCENQNFKVMPSQEESILESNNLSDSDKLVLNYERLRTDVQPENLKLQNTLFQNHDLANYHLLSKIDEQTEITESVDIHSNVSDISGIHDLSGDSIHNNSQSKESTEEILSSHESNNNLQTSDANTSDSYKFNDTLEEMEMALKQGLDYVLPEDVENKDPKVSNPTPTATFVSAIPRAVPSKCKKVNKFEHVHSPVGDYIQKKSPKPEPFKIPIKRVKTKHLQTPNGKTRQQFPNVVSPVGVYIKNSPCVLKRNVIPKTVHSLVKRPLCEISSNGKSGGETYEISKAVYKSGMKIITSDTTDVVLPSNIQRLVIDNRLETHEKRMAKITSDASISNKLMEADLTLKEPTSQEISFIASKNVFIK